MIKVIDRNEESQLDDYREPYLSRPRLRRQRCREATISEEDDESHAAADLTIVDLPGCHLSAPPRLREATSAHATDR